VEPRGIRICLKKRKWESCSTVGRATLINELFGQPDDFRKQIIVHELMHLKVPNHGSLFKAMVRTALALEKIGIRKR
jgi:hypothetical protein